MKQKLKDLFDYNHTMNLKVIALINTHKNNLSEKTFKLFSHTLNAHQIWNARVNGLPEFQVWQLNNWLDVDTINETNYQSTLQILYTEDLNNSIHYSNSKGESFSNKLEDILFHIINHSTYHRAQIATECRNYGIEPLLTDYILYKRNMQT